MKRYYDVKVFINGIGGLNNLAYLECDDQNRAVVSGIDTKVSPINNFDFPKNYVSLFDFSKGYEIVTDENNICKILEFKCNIEGDKSLSFTGREAITALSQFIAARNTLGITNTKPEGNKADVIDITRAGR